MVDPIDTLMILGILILVPVLLMMLRSDRREFEMRQRHVDQMWAHAERVRAIFEAQYGPLDPDLAAKLFVRHESEAAKAPKRRQFLFWWRR